MSEIETDCAWNIITTKDTGISTSSLLGTTIKDDGRREKSVVTDCD